MMRIYFIIKSLRLNLCVNEYNYVENLNLCFGTDTAFYSLLFLALVCFTNVRDLCGR